MPQPTPSNPLDRMRTGFNVVAFVARSFAMICEVFMHFGFGSRYLGLHAMAGMLLIPLWAVFWPGRDPSLLLFFWFAYLLALGAARAGIIRSIRRGDKIHSRYNGTPTLLRKRPHLNEVAVKRIVEPIVAMVGGIVLAGLVDPVLGSFLIAAGIGLLIDSNLTEAVQQARAQDTFDAMLEQEQLAHRVRRIRGDGF